VFLYPGREWGRRKEREADLGCCGVLDYYLGLVLIGVLVCLMSLYHDQVSWAWLEKED
jgi:hypothetical protein